jgi:hypothetical protein
MLDRNILRIVSSEVVEATRDSFLIGQISERLQAQRPDAPKGSEELRRQRQIIGRLCDHRLSGKIWLERPHDVRGESGRG